MVRLFITDSFINYAVMRSNHAAHVKPSAKANRGDLRWQESGGGSVEKSAVRQCSAPRSSPGVAPDGDRGSTSTGAGLLRTFGYKLLTGLGQGRPAAASHGDCSSNSTCFGLSLYFLFKQISPCHI